MLVRKKRQYMTLPTQKELGYRRYGWRGLPEFLFLVVSFAVPQSLFLWRWSVAAGDAFVFWMMSISFTILFGIFVVIARPMRWCRP